jgi:hypothetical protein
MPRKFLIFWRKVRGIRWLEKLCEAVAIHARICGIEAKAKKGKHVDPGSKSVGRRAFGAIHQYGSG